jgi:hypothetical protein
MARTWLLRCAVPFGFAAVLSVAWSRRDAAADATAPDPKSFVARVDNPYFPLTPGTTYTYRGSKDGHAAVDIFAVTDRVKVIQGVRCVEVLDRLYLDGVLEETTRDWFAQDVSGTVWYFGEATKELDAQGRVVTTEGSWQAGEHGARAGVVMPARPRVGQRFQQEHAKDVAEDHFEILSLSARVAVPFGRYTRTVLTKEWTPLEPGVIDHKSYAQGIGVVREASVRSGAELLELVRVTHGDRAARS